MLLSSFVHISKQQFKYKVKTLHAVTAVLYIGGLQYQQCTKILDNVLQRVRQLCWHLVHIRSRRQAHVCRLEPSPNTTCAGGEYFRGVGQRSNNTRFAGVQHSTPFDKVFHGPRGDCQCVSQKVRQGVAPLDVDKCQITCRLACVQPARDP